MCYLGESSCAKVQNDRIFQIHSGGLKQNARYFSDIK